MGYQFEVGDRVRVARRFDGLEKGTEGKITSTTEPEAWPYRVDWPTRKGWVHSADELELIDTPKSPIDESKSIPVSKFEIYGCGIQSLLGFVTAFQEAGEENFSVSWTLSGTGTVASPQGGA